MEPFPTDCELDSLLELQHNNGDRTKTVPGTDDEDDDKIFNFGLEPDDTTKAPQPANTSTLRLRPKPAIKVCKSVSPEAINYESAIVYICPACGAEFDVQNDWKRHINDAHNFNTRRGLNFVQVDKLYHECLECDKRIAMHAMENLMKHKFTHLPFRCSKCKICLREYKYRQDLMVHLRMRHREDLANCDAILPTLLPTTPHIAGKHLEIKEVKENAIDIFESTSDIIEVKNEVIEDDDNDPIHNGISETEIESSEPKLDAELSRDSTQHMEMMDNKEEEDEECEQYITYICAKCGSEHDTEREWTQHISVAHNYDTREGLHFELVNEEDAQCLQCNMVLAAASLRGMQQHSFTHLPHKSAVRCKLCLRSFQGHKEIRKHLRSQHHLGDDSTDDWEEDMDVDSEQPWLTDNNQRDPYESHIGYLCPQCGKEFLERKHWRRHIVKAHRLTDLKVLNFKMINDRQVMCLECDKIITNAYGIQNAQQHRITHMPYKAFIRCRLCEKVYTDRKGVVKHLRSVHRIYEERSQFGIQSEPPPLVPMSRATTYVEPPPPQRQYRSNPVTEIVRHANYTYEIQYLDDDEVGEDELNAPVKSSRHLKADSARYDDTTVPELLFENARAQQESSQISAACLPIRRAHYGSAAASRSQTMETSLKRNTPTPTITGKQEKAVNSTNSIPATISSHGGIEKNFCFLCPACGVEFKAQFEWRHHINEAHNFSKRSYLNFRPIDKFHYQCMQCHDVVANTKLKALQDHKFRHLPHKLYIKCLLCSASYNHKPNMINHLRVRHDIVDNTAALGQQQHYQQPANSDKRAIASTLAVAEPKISTGASRSMADDTNTFYNAVDHESITYFCPQCNENFSAHIAWRKHIVNVHGLNRRQGLNFRQIDEHHFMCLQCYKRVTVTHSKGATGQLQSHKFRHLPYKSFKCLACGRDFVRKQMFFKHLNKRTNRCRSSGAITASAAIRSKPPQPAVQPQSEEADRSLLSAASSNRRVEWNPQDHFNLFCPECGKSFDSWVPWREHINIVHELGKREKLRYKKLNASLHQCLECGERVSGKKLRDLQIHRFKHLPHAAYIQCKFCTASYCRIRAIKIHLQQKHPDKLRKYGDDTQSDSAHIVNDISQQPDMESSPVVEINEDAAADHVDEDIENIVSDEDEDLVEIYMNNENDDEMDASITEEHFLSD